MVTDATCWVLAMLTVASSLLGMWKLDLWINSSAGSPDPGILFRLRIFLSSDERLIRISENLRTNCMGRNDGNYTASLGMLNIVEKNISWRRDRAAAKSARQAMKNIRRNL